MPQIFHRSTNILSRVSIFGAVFIIAGAFYVGGLIVRSPYATSAQIIRDQPVEFSHKHHVTDDGLDCRYCHISVETSSFAGIPPTATCMGCHSQIWADSPQLAPVHESWRENKPLAWSRVHDLQDFVYFDHSAHVNKGVGCATCHGQVDQMPLTWQEETLLMEWCLECHRHPEKYVRPREEVFNMDWTPPVNQLAAGLELVEKYNIQRKTSCSTCHR